MRSTPSDSKKIVVSLEPDQFLRLKNRQENAFTTDVNDENMPPVPLLQGETITIKNSSTDESFTATIDRALEVPQLIERLPYPRVVIKIHQ